MLSGQRKDYAMKCPICKKDLEDMKYKPFCSKRCADIDLGNWLNGSYAIPAEELDEEDVQELQEAMEKKLYEECDNKE